MEHNWWNLTIANHQVNAIQSETIKWDRVRSTNIKAFHVAGWMNRAIILNKSRFVCSYVCNEKARIRSGTHLLRRRRSRPWDLSTQVKRCAKTHIVYLLMWTWIDRIGNFLEVAAIWRSLDYEPPLTLPAWNHHTPAWIFYTLQIIKMRDHNHIHCIKMNHITEDTVNIGHLIVCRKIKKVITELKVLIVTYQ